MKSGHCWVLTDPENQHSSVIYLRITHWRTRKTYAYLAVKEGQEKAFGISNSASVSPLPRCIFITGKTWTASRWSPPAFSTASGYSVNATRDKYTWQKNYWT